jgi:FMN reductase
MGGRNMRIVGIAGSIVGSKTRTAVKQVLDSIKDKNPEIAIELINLADYQIQFSDGRDFRDYQDDTRNVIEKIMSADAYIIGTPTFQASIPGTLKNIFDLLPIDVFKDKVIGVVATAGSAKHYLMVEHHLKPILNYMKAIVVPKYAFVEEKDFLNGEIVDDEIIFRLNHLAEDTVVMINAIKAVLEAKENAYLF